MHIFYRLIFICLIWRPCFLNGLSTEEILHNANTSYQQGQAATTYNERMYAFNRALFFYDLLEQKLKQDEFAIETKLADCYFQLEEYAWAILYDLRALRKHPDDQLTIMRLQHSRQQLGLPLSSNNFFDIFFSYSTITWFIFFILIFAIGITQSIAIWSDRAWANRITKMFIYLTSFCIIAWTLLYYLLPLEGVLVKSTALYRGANRDESYITAYPLLAGSKVQVLQVNLEGTWLKIADHNGTIGHVPAESIRLI